MVQEPKPVTPWEIIKSVPWFFYFGAIGCSVKPAIDNLYKYDPHLELKLTADYVMIVVMWISVAAIMIINYRAAKRQFEEQKKINKEFKDLGITFAMTDVLIVDELLAEQPARTEPDMEQPYPSVFSPIIQPPKEEQEDPHWVKLIGPGERGFVTYEYRP